MDAESLERIIYEEEGGYVLDWYDGPLTIFTLKNGEVLFFRILRDHQRHENHFYCWICEKTTKEKLKKYLRGEVDYRSFCKELTNPHILMSKNGKKKLYKAKNTEEYLPLGDDHSDKHSYYNLLYWNSGHEEPKDLKISDLKFYIDEDGTYLFINKQSKEIWGLSSSTFTFLYHRVRDESSQFIYEYVLDSNLKEAKIEELLTNQNLKTRGFAKGLLEGTQE